MPLLKRRTKKAGTGDFTAYADRYTPGNKVSLLADGDEAFRAMLEAVDQARATVHLETYIFRADRTGHEFAQRLMAKARSGVRVRLIIDAVGCLDLSPVLLTQMRNAGVQALEYHPVTPWRPRWSWGRRDHRKILVIDGKVGFCGGMNISDDHASPSKGGAGWRDMHARVEGPAAYDLDRVFRAVWFRESGRWFASEGRPDVPAGPARVWVASNEEFINRYRIRSAYLRVLDAAQSSVDIANAYFVPDRLIRHALAAAVKRGVQVRILVPGRSDVVVAWYMGRRRYDYLLRHGVRIFEWPGPMLHCKAAAVDGAWAAVGSYNLDHRSLLHNLEVNLHILDPDFSGVVAAEVEADIARSHEITLEAWRKRPLLDKIFERFFYIFRYFF